MSEQEEKKSSGGALKYFFWLMVIGIIAVAGCFLFVTNKGMNMTKETVVRVFRGFKPTKVISGFNEWRDLQVTSNEGNILEVATGEQTVELSRESSIEMFGKTVPGITASSKIVVPATFRYHIDLKGTWNLIEDGNRLHVVAPPLQPSLPIAFDTEKMERINPEGWSKYISGANMKELEKSITPELKLKATDPENIKLFEAEAKKSIAKFLQTWLIGEKEWAEGRFEEIIVYFDGDVIDTEIKDLMPDAKIETEPLL
ncbi:MAG: hypothetical protein P1U89_18470 [Verrucomicrobiales bacterium]|nr:hypothetical protein [Verrucomicrobiales bacterium]